jgi:hypothetical protein
MSFAPVFDGSDEASAWPVLESTGVGWRRYSQPQFDSNNMLQSAIGEMKVLKRIVVLRV